MTEIFIPYNVPSSKNSKQIIKNRYTGKPLIINSQVTTRYKHLAGVHYSAYRKSFYEMTKGICYPLKINFQFIRETKGRFDLCNMVQIVQDMMVEYSWIPDDNYTILVPYFDKPVLIDKDNAGVIISVWRGNNEN